MGRVKIKLEAVFTSVTRSRDQAIDARDLAEREMIIANRGDRHRCKRLQNLKRARTLNRKLRISRTGVLDVRAVTIVLIDVCEIADMIRVVDAQEIVLIRHPEVKAVEYEGAEIGHQA